MEPQLRAAEPTDDGDRPRTGIGSGDKYEFGHSFECGDPYLGVPGRRDEGAAPAKQSPFHAGEEQRQKEKEKRE